MFGKPHQHRRRLKSNALTFYLILLVDYLKCKLCIFHHNSLQTYRPHTPTPDDGNFRTMIICARKLTPSALSGHKRRRPHPHAQNLPHVLDPHPMEWLVNFVLLSIVRDVVNARYAPLPRRQRLRFLPPSSLLLLSETLKPSFGAGILRCRVGGCRAEMEWFA